MTVSYAGVDLLIEDRDRRLQRWLDAHQDLADLRSVSFQYSGRVSTRTGSRSGNTGGRGYPLPNYPTPPRIKLNTLYWPTGATRWSMGWFLADRQRKDEIEQLAHSGGTSTAQPLVMTHPEGDEVSALMHLLPPRPISPADHDEGVWIVPLVDARFFWQDAYVGNLEVTYGSTWGNVFSAIGTAIGETIQVGNISSAYQIPDSQELTRRYENAAALFDAVAHSVGHRVVVDFDGSVHSMDWDTSNERLEENLGGDWKLITGDSIGADPAPSSLTVTFPKYNHRVPHCDGDVHAVAGEVNPDLSSGVTKTIHSTMFADYTDGAGPASPDNSAKLGLLAAAITSDFKQSVSKNYDRTFIGVKSWQTTGWCDHVEFALGHQRQDGSYAGSTRAQSKPHNLRTEEQLSQDSNLKVIGHFNIGKIASGGEVATNNLAADADYKGKIVLWDGNSAENSDGNTETTSTDEIDAFMWQPVHFYEGEKVQTVWDCESNRHYPLGMPFDFHRRTSASSQSWVDATTDIDFSDQTISGNTDVFADDGNGGIKVLIDTWVWAWYALGPYHTSTTSPAAVLARATLYKNGAIQAASRMNLMVENGLQYGVGGVIPPTLVSCAANDILSVRVLNRSGWTTDYGFEGHHTWFCTWRVRRPAP